MRILLDECLDEGLRHCFDFHDCQTCRYAGLEGINNGELLAAAEKLGFEVLVTVDQNMPYQQKLQGRVIRLVILRARSSDFGDLMGLIPDLLVEMVKMKPGDVIRVGNT